MTWTWIISWLIICESWLFSNQRIKWFRVIKALRWIIVGPWSRIIIYFVSRLSFWKLVPDRFVIHKVVRSGTWTNLCLNSFHLWRRWKFMARTSLLNFFWIILSDTGIYIFLNFHSWSSRYNCIRTAILILLQNRITSWSNFAAWSWITVLSNCHFSPINKFSFLWFWNTNSTS